MDVDAGTAVSPVAAAIGEPARARMLYCLMDGRSRTSTELAIVAQVTPSTASIHLKRLVAAHLLTLFVQGRHRYYSLSSPDVAQVLESLSVVAGGTPQTFVPTTPASLRAARTCYDHIAGSLGVWLHDRMTALGWLTPMAEGRYDLTPLGRTALEAVGVDVARTAGLRRRFACACLDWSERRPHLGGALGAALLSVARRQRWVASEIGDRSLSVTRAGERALAAHFGSAVGTSPEPTSRTGGRRAGRRE